MNLRDIIIVGVALAMDAVGVSLSIGLNSRVSRGKKIAFILFFAIFQFLLFFLGGVGGHLFQRYITAIPSIIGGVAIAIVGIMMIKEGIENDDKDESILLKKGMVLILGLSVSIDAFVIGFIAFNNIISILTMVSDALIVGAITLILCLAAFYLCRYIRKIEFISKYADFLGGIILIIFAIKMIFF